MNQSLSRHLLFMLCLATGQAVFAAEGKTSPADPTKDSAKPVTLAQPDSVLVLPKIEVTAQRIKKLDKDIARLDKMIIREQKKVKSSDLDKALNNTQVTRAAAIFGGNSADHLSAVAATRVALLESERGVLEAMKRPATLDELSLMEAEVEQLRLARRNLDDASKQR